MIYPSIRIEGAILSPDILDHLDDAAGQRPADFGLDTGTKVKDEIARAWADAQDYWRIFQRKLETLRPDSPATTETRQQWITPLLGLLGYQLEFQAKGVELNGKTYAISHRVTNRGNTPIHIVGARETAGLDRKPERTHIGAPRMSAHALVQEYLNLHDELYGIVTNGRVLRLLRDSSRLIKLSYLEFDLDRIFGDGLFADFAILYRLLHVSRLPANAEAAAESLIERYHQDSLDSGARIREGLSKAVEQAIRDFANGFLVHPANDELRQSIADGKLKPETYYQHLLRLIYRLLFLLVIEERDLVFPSSASSQQREIYRRYYSLERLRLLSEKRHLADKRHHDLWLAMLATFRLFEAHGPGDKLGLAPLAGDLFSPAAIGPLASAMLGNDVLLGCLRALGLYQHPENGQTIRVNYAALNVEEFGSVYEGLLEYEPVFLNFSPRPLAGAPKVGNPLSGKQDNPSNPDSSLEPNSPFPLPGGRLGWGLNHGIDNASRNSSVSTPTLALPLHGGGNINALEFAFAQGDQRAATGSHYTPDDLVQPLIKHSLDYLIAERLEKARELANSEVAIKGRNFYVHQFVSRLDRVAERNATGGGLLPTYAAVSSGGTIRADIPDSPGGGINTGEHRGGLGAGGNTGVHPVSPNSTGQPERIGNAPDPKPKGRTGDGGRDNRHAESMQRNGENDSFPDWFFAAQAAVAPTSLPPYSLLAEKALLSLRVADISCGSGHILLAAARRIATELAIVRTGEEQPSPSAFRSAIRDVIRNCIYGVDLNPLAVELCKVALWLEAHSPGEPLNFLDHHIKCGNAIVGFARREEAERGVPDEAFATMPGDDKEIATILRKRNKQERKDHEAGQLPLSPSLQKQLDDILRGWRDLATLPEHTPDEIEAKKARYLAFSQSEDAWFLNQIAAIPIAQFYLPKAADNLQKFVTDATYRRYWKGEMSPQGQATAEAWSMALRKRFFHWFLEFPELFGTGSREVGNREVGGALPHSLSGYLPASNGFDCILGNPPYLGGQGLSGTYGQAFCEYVKWEYAPTGLSDLVVFFVRRIYSLLRPGGFTAFITTNSIKDGDIRKDGLEQVLAQGGAINMAVRGIKWPGLAKLVVSLVALHKGDWRGKRMLDGKEVPAISAYFEDSEDAGEPKALPENANSVYQGSIFLGDGFLLTHAEADRLIEAEPRNREVIFPVTNGQEINNQPDQAPQRKTINFSDWHIERAEQYALPYERILTLVKPVRDKDNMKSRREKWWQFGALAAGLYTGISPLPHCFVAARTTKYLNFSAAPTSYVFTDALYVFTTDRYDLYAVVQSTLHEVWARKYSGALKQDLRYSPSKCFDTFPFPEGLWQTANPLLADLGEHYHEYRRTLMRQLWLGLTDIYNLFHTRDLTPAQVAKVSKKSVEEAEAGYQGILELRRLHRELDIAIRDAYGWHELDLGHDFIEVETLPENDRVRYTISPAARKEVLKRLLAENHRRAAAQALAADAATPTKKKRGKKSASDDAHGDLFS